jgi:hypothetical protein
MRLRDVITCGLIAALLGGGVSPVSAQVVSSMTVGAVVGEAVATTTLQNLLFGRTFPGTPRAVAPTDNNPAGPQAGLVYIKGQKNKDVLVSFSLPPSLTSGSNSMPVDTWTGCHNPTNTTTGCTSFTPSFSGTLMQLIGNPADPPPRTSGHRYVFIGATARPAASQAAGTYTGTVTVSVVYF